MKKGSGRPLHIQTVEHSWRSENEGRDELTSRSIPSPKVSSVARMKGLLSFIYPSIYLFRRGGRGHIYLNIIHIPAFSRS